MVRPNHRAVDHLHAVQRSAAVVQRLQHQLPDAGQRPAPELPVDRRPFAETIVQIAPRRTGSRDPEHPVKHAPMIRRRASALVSRRNHERREKRPFLIRHQAPNQDRLPKNSLESRPKIRVNPLCQQDLELYAADRASSARWYSSALGRTFSNRCRMTLVKSVMIKIQQA